MSNQNKQKLLRVYIAIDLYDQIVALINQGKFTDYTDYLRSLIRKDLDSRK